MRQAHEDAISAADDRRVRCGLVTPALAYGGAERWIIDLMRWTDARRVRWVGAVLTERADGAPETLAEVRSLCPLHLGEEAVASLAREVDVLLHWGIPELERSVPPDAASRVIGVSHGSGPWTARCFTGDYPGRWDVAAVSREALRPLPPTLRERAAVLYNGVDLRRLAPGRWWEQREAWGVPRNANVAGFLGRVSAEKNPLGFVRMLQHLPPCWCGLVVGTGGDLPLIRHEAARLGVVDRLITPGFVPEVGAALAVFDTLVMPAHEEGYGLALVEAMLAGVPVVATPVGIVPEVPDLVRPVPLRPSGEQLAAAVLRDWSDLPGTGARVEGARRWALEHATAERFGAAWTEYLCRSTPAAIRGVEAGGSLGAPGCIAPACG